MVQPRRKMFGPLIPTILIVVLTVAGLLGVSRAWRMMIEWREARAQERAFRGPNPSVREGAANQIAARGSDACWPIFLAATHDGRRDVRLLAYRHLAHSVLRPAKVIPVLIAAAGDDQPDIRAEAVRGLGSIQARWAQRTTDPTRIACLETLRGLLKDPSPVVRAVAVAALAGSGADPATTAALLSATSDQDRSVQLAAARALIASPGEAGRQARLTLVALVADPDPLGDRREILNLLMNTTDDSLEKAVTALAKLLSNRDSFVHADVIDCLLAVGTHARAAVPALERLWNDRHYELRGQAGLAIVHILAQPPPPSFDSLRTSRMMAMMAGQTTTTMGLVSESFYPRQPNPRITAILVGIATDSTLTLIEREAAVSWLRDTNSQTITKATTELVRQLANQARQVRMDAAELLARIIDLTPATIPAVEAQDHQ